MQAGFRKQWGNVWGTNRACGKGAGVNVVWCKLRDESAIGGMCRTANRGSGEAKGATKGRGLASRRAPPPQAFNQWCTLLNRWDAAGLRPAGSGAAGRTCRCRTSCSGSRRSCPGARLATLASRARQRAALGVLARAQKMPSQRFLGAGG